MKKLKTYFFILCLSFLKVEAQEVWPGDANRDSIVNNIDLLYIARNNTNLGSARSSISNSFVAHAAPFSWGISYYGVGSEYSDCNGDGIVDNNDTVALNINYGLSYGNYNIDYYNGINNNIRIISNQDTVGLGDTLQLTFEIDSVSLDYILGFAYTLGYDAEFENLISSFKMNYDNVWLADLNNNFSIAKHSASLNSLEFAYARNDFGFSKGGGNVGELSIVIEEDLLGGTIENNSDFTLEFKNVVLAKNFKLDTIGSISKTIYFRNKTTNILNDEIETLNIYPNPSNDIINISGDTKFNSYSILDISSKLIKQNSMYTNFINIKELDIGIYYLKLKNEKHTIIKRIIKI